MPKKLLKQWLPDTKRIKNHKHLQVFGRLLQDPNLWHLNRYSVSMAFSVGLFVAFIPIPFQMVLAGALAIFVRSNLPLSVCLVWFSNPLTMGPLFLFAYKLGTWVLNIPVGKFHFELSFNWLTTGLAHIWEPFLLGCLMCGAALAVLSNILVRIFWRYWVSKHWKRRQALRVIAQKIAKKTGDLRKKSSSSKDR